VFENLASAFLNPWIQLQIAVSALLVAMALCDCNRLHLERARLRMLSKNLETSRRLKNASKEIRDFIGKRNVNPSDNIQAA